MKIKDENIGLSIIDILKRLSNGDKSVEKFYNIIYIPHAPFKEHVSLDKGHFTIEGNSFIPTPSSIEFDRICKVPEFWQIEPSHCKPITIGSEVCVHTILCIENIVFKYDDCKAIKDVAEKMSFDTIDRKFKKTEVCDDIDISCQGFYYALFGLLPIEGDYEKKELKLMIDYFKEGAL